MPPSSRGWVGVLHLRNWSWKHHALSPITRRWASTSASIVASKPAQIQLRDYQEECIQAVLTNLKEGHKRLGVSLATGSGKTVIFTHLIDRVVPHSKAAYQTLILAHRQELVEQAVRHCRNTYPDKNVGVEMGNIHADESADIVVASVQSIVSGDRMQKFDPSRFKLVLVDEAHHIVAPGYLKTLAYFGLSTATPNSPALVGVSATLSRFDGLKLGAAIDRIVYHKDYIDMIGDKWLSDVCFTTAQSKADISAVKKGNNGDFLSSDLSRLVNTDQTNEVTVRTWFAKAERRKATLVFCVDLAHVAGLTNKFREHGVDARFVTGSTPKAERVACLDSFKRGDFPVLVNCGVFTEGTDIPSIDCVLLARPTKSRNLLVQMIGRGMRLYPGKKNCHIIDMVASLETGIVTTPTLFGLDPSEVLEESSVEDMDELKARREEDKLKQKETNMSSKSSSTWTGAAPKSVTFTDYDSVFDLIEDTSGERNIRAISHYSWVCIGTDRYVLSHSNGSFLKIERSQDEGGEFVVTNTVSLNKSMSGSKSPLMRPRQIAKSLTLADAIHAADTYAKRLYPIPVYAKNALWRTRDATEGQIMFLNKLRPKNDQLLPNSITKGKAGDMITKIKHGARGRFSSLEADRRKLGRAKLKLEQDEALKSREEVSVGPLLE